MPSVGKSRFLDDKDEVKFQDAMLNAAVHYFVECCRTAQNSHEEIGAEKLNKAVWQRRGCAAIHPEQVLCPRRQRQRQRQGNIVDEILRINTFISVIWQLSMLNEPTYLVSDTGIIETFIDISFKYKNLCCSKIRPQSEQTKHSSEIIIPPPDACADVFQ